MSWIEADWKIQEYELKIHISKYNIFTLASDMA